MLFTICGRMIPFNSDVLRWARERVRLSPETAAHGAGVTPDQIQKWEAGSARPTIKQGRKLAHFYDVPFMELLSQTIKDRKTRTRLGLQDASRSRDSN
ncbi:multiprotein-bridging factor 1 family protein [Bradyrhizobium sp.]|uniref:helix-turn-helix domain-containing protein n=1 Tax=Bradyrhizobium sp. TaxID=376 RepID=UPI0035239EED